MDEALLDLLEYIAQTVHGLRAPRVRITRRVRNRVGDRDGWICRICDGLVGRDRPWIRAAPGEPFVRGSNNLHPSVEHVVSVGVGGTNDEGNLAICHLVCNSSQSHEGREAGNYMEIRRATAATQVLKAVRRIRDEGYEQAGEAMDEFDLGLLLGWFKEVGRGGETLPVRRYLRERSRRAGILDPFRLHDAGTVVPGGLA